MQYFPRDIVSKTAADREKDSRETAKFVLAVLTVITAILIVIISRAVINMNIPLIIPISTILLIYGLIGITIFRFLIYREQDRLSRGKDTILNYYGIKSKSSLVDGVEVFYYENGNPFIIVRLRAGAYSEVREENAKLMLSYIFDLAEEYKLAVSVIGIPEQFNKTIEYKNMMKVVDGIQDPLLKQTTLSVYEGYLEETDRKSNLTEIALRFSCKTKLFEDDIEPFARRLEMLINTTLPKTLFRSAEFLNLTEINELMRSFLNIKVLNLSLAEVEHSIDSKEFQNIAAVVSVVTEDNQEWEVSVPNSLDKNKLIEIN